ncbi:MAG: SprT family protein [Bacillota bacterium]|uniref:SprT family protein n=1 Tax=Virgibacillus salarius TaxID=447199 RepID=A0A941DVS5_9BACI|nr:MULTISPECIES: SprT family protein [Virgibacillus]NAZ08965.1 SprT family protein [Agaribacter marinus]MBR7796257.1 SprT family protein [Virgibacillus salarius]MCC2251769.1 SprT family protein [Virgibacillus sp. AGTR]MDY7046669.1 SprT family protein [Virgibacillus sp. M23]QRZ19688.1 SprT family protein [Virgibacillus sp. AGTR]
MELLDDQDLFNLVNKLSLTYFHKPFLHDVAFNFRLRTTGGRYIPNKKLIELNPKYMQESDMEEFIGIIKHELCHYHLHIEGRGYRHRDQAFKQLLKITGSPRHCKPLPSQKKYKYVYKCTSCNDEFKRMRRVNTAKFRCGKCKGRIYLL